MRNKDSRKVSSGFSSMLFRLRLRFVKSRVKTRGTVEEAYPRR